MNINGIAHIQLTVNNFQRSSPFYEKLLEFLEMKTIFKTDDTLYCVGGRTGIAITQAKDVYVNEQFIQSRVGLHHFCLRAREKDDVDKFYSFLLSLSAKIIRKPEEGKWAPGYYSVLFEDPDGIRIEMSFVPGQGNLDQNMDFPLPISLI